MQRINTLDPRFSLKLCVPAEPHKLFPEFFAYVNPKRLCENIKTISESDVSFFAGDENESDEEDAPLWDITWGWDFDLPCTPEGGEREQLEEDEEANNVTSPEPDQGGTRMNLQDGNVEMVLRIVAGWQRDLGTQLAKGFHEMNLDQRKEEGTSIGKQHESVEAWEQIRLLWDDG